MKLLTFYSDVCHSAFRVEQEKFISANCFDFHINAKGI